MSESLLLVDNCINYACTKHAHTVNDQLSNHSVSFKQGIYQVCDIFYLAVGYGIANITMIVGTDGIIIIDTAESYEVAEKVLQDFRKITDKPVKAIIYTHNHLDHIAGVRAFATKEQVTNKEISIFAHAKIMEGVVNNASVVGPIINTRAISTFGLTLETNTTGHINDGLGPRFRAGNSTFIHPTTVFNDKLEVTIAGIKMIMQYAPSETEDEIFIYFPDYNVIQSADIIMGETYPNIYSIRGTANRDPVKWYESIDLMRKLNPDYLIPSHGRPLEGKTNVYNMLTAYRDAIQFTHDQTVRYINKGYTPDELVEVISCLPDNLREHPWLQEYYGTVKHSVRQIYFGYLGWFQGDPTFLDPHSPAVRAENHIKAFGGRENVLKIACDAIDKKDYKWGAEILTYLITYDRKDKTAKCLKAQCLRELGYDTKNTNWRNWYLTSANELNDTINYDLVELTHGCDSDDIIAEIPISIFLKRLCILIDPSKSKNVYTTMGFNIIPDNTLYVLEVRYAVVEFHDTNDNIKQIDHCINLSDNTLRKLFLKKITLQQAIHEKLITYGHNTNHEAIIKFFDYFDLNILYYPALTQPHL